MVHYQSSSECVLDLFSALSDSHHSLCPLWCRQGGGIQENGRIDKKDDEGNGCGLRIIVPHCLHGDYSQSDIVTLTSPNSTQTNSRIM